MKPMFLVTSFYCPNDCDKKSDQEQNQAISWPDSTNVEYMNPFTDLQGNVWYRVHSRLFYPPVGFRGKYIIGTESLAPPIAAINAKLWILCITEWDQIRDMYCYQVNVWISAQ